MSKLPLPSRGQPIDLSYLYQIANAINDLSSQFSSATYKYVAIDDPTSRTTNTVTINESKIVATYKEVASNSTVNAGNEITFSHSFDSDFRFPPIVTATPINVGNTSAGKDVSVVLKNVTTSRVEGIVKFATSGDVSVGINIISIGVPN